MHLSPSAKQHRTFWPSKRNRVPGAIGVAGYVVHKRRISEEAALGQRRCDWITPSPLAVVQHPSFLSAPQLCWGRPFYHSPVEFITQSADTPP